mmetsp:Transcript_10125/g.38402  ORF Transcript_10125/g.38402 Transcript_10125/m.38402 type:complete len:281 (-) Transcript_10125:884-1726(-)
MAPLPIHGLPCGRDRRRVLHRHRRRHLAVIPGSGRGSDFAPPVVRRRHRRRRSFRCLLGWLHVALGSFRARRRIELRGLRSAGGKRQLFAEAQLFLFQRLDGGWDGFLPLFVCLGHDLRNGSGLGFRLDDRRRVAVLRSGNRHSRAGLRRRCDWLRAVVSRVLLGRLISGGLARRRRRGGALRLLSAALGLAKQAGHPREDTMLGISAGCPPLIPFIRLRLVVWVLLLLQLRLLRLRLLRLRLLWQFSLLVVLIGNDVLLRGIRSREGLARDQGKPRRSF